MAIDKEEITKRANKIEERGLDSNVLEEANRLYNISINKAENAFGKEIGTSFDETRLNTHIRPKNLAYFMEIFGNQDFSSMKSLDIGCGMPSSRSTPSSSYAPILSIALNELGVSTYAIDMYGDEEIMKRLGINFERTNMAFADLLGKNNPEFVKENDFVSARSFLGGGFYNPEGMQFGVAGAKSLNEEDAREWDFYSKFIKQFRDINNQPAVYEIDTPSAVSVYAFREGRSREDYKEIGHKEIVSMENELIGEAFGTKPINRNNGNGYKPFLIMDQKGERR